jgi:hypothetical protein
LALRFLAPSAPLSWRGFFIAHGQVAFLTARWLKEARCLHCTAFDVLALRQKGYSSAYNLRSRLHTSLNLRERLRVMWFSN